MDELEQKIKHTKNQIVEEQTYIDNIVNNIDLDDEDKKALSKERKKLDNLIGICNYISDIKCNAELCGRNVNNTEIASFFGVSRESIRQVLDSGLRKLRVRGARELFYS